MRGADLPGTAAVLAVEQRRLQRMPAVAAKMLPAGARGDAVQGQCGFDQPVRMREMLRVVGMIALAWFFLVYVRGE